MESSIKVDLSNKVALITGSGRGIGRQIALKMAENGADIVVNDLIEENGLKVVEEIEAMGRKAVFLYADIGNSDEAIVMAEKAIAAFGKIDILVNNAGINYQGDARRPMFEYSIENWNNVINVCLNGTFYVSKPVMAQMVERKCGSIINISSVAGHVPLRNQGAYVAAKAGVSAMTKAMAIELAPYGIRANAIAPGSTSDLKPGQTFFPDKEKNDSQLSHIPLNRIGTTTDMANAALFFASDASSYVTGDIMIVDGGWICGFNRDW